MQARVSETKVHPAELGSGGAPFDGWLLVDVRTPAEFAGAHIEGSLNVPLGDVERSAPDLREQAARRRIALVCRTGRRAEEARGILLRGGCEPVHVLAGGIVAWEQARLPLLRGKGGMSIERQVRVVAGSLVVLGVILGFLAHPLFFWLSAFVGAGLLVAGLTDTCGMGMLLAKMPWNRAPATRPEE